ncbi:MAG: SPOCS domain-containing protein [Lachnospirales bacterium]
MSILKKEKIYLDKCIDKEKNQIRLEGDIIVPDVKPDVYKVLETSYNAEIVSNTITDGKVIYKGFLDVNILYISDTKEVYSMSHTLNIDDYFDLDYINESCIVDVDCVISHIDFRIVNDRKVSYKAIANISLEGISKKEIEFISDVENCDKSTFLKKEDVVSVNHFIKEEINIHDEFKIKSSSTNIKEILQVNVSFLSKEAKIQNGKIHIYGDLFTTVFYKSEDNTNLVEQIESETHFTGVLDKDFDDNCIINCKFKIADYKGKVQLDEDNEERVISLDALILCNIRVTSSKKINLIYDAHIINNKLDITSTTLPVYELVSKNKNQSTFREVLELEENSSPILQIFSAKANAIVDDIVMGVDKTVITGAINTNILYISSDDNLPIQSYMWTFPFEQVVETKNSLDTMQPSVRVDIDHCLANMITEKEVEIKVSVSFATEVTCEKSFTFVENLLITPLTEEEILSIPSVIVHVVDKNENLWHIAKAYNTETSDILDLNNLEDDTCVATGDKLIICKRVFS